jgi:hypothetical protein
MVAKVSIGPDIAGRDAGDSVWINAVNGLFDDIRATGGELHRDSAAAFPEGFRGIPETVYITVALGSLHGVCGVIKEWLKRQGRTVTMTISDERGERVTTLDGSMPDEAITEVLRHAVSEGRAVTEARAVSEGRAAGEGPVVGEGPDG